MLPATSTRGSYCKSPNLPDSMHVAHTVCVYNGLLRKIRTCTVALEGDRPVRPAWNHVLTVCGPTSPDTCSPPTVVDFRISSFITVHLELQVIKKITACEAIVLRSMMDVNLDKTSLGARCCFLFQVQTKPVCVWSTRRMGLSTSHDNVWMYLLPDATLGLHSVTFWLRGDEL